MRKEVACLGQCKTREGRERRRCLSICTMFSEAGVRCEGVGPIGEASVWVGRD